MLIFLTLELLFLSQIFVINLTLRGYFTVNAGRVYGLATVGDLPTRRSRRSQNTLPSNCAMNVYVIETDSHKACVTRADEVALGVRVASMVFCTIENVDEALQEVTYVLKPDGEFRFLEHVEANSWLTRVQRLCSPLCRHLASGCRLTRRPYERFEQTSDFAAQAMQRLRLGIPPVRPFVRCRLQPLESLDTSTSLDYLQF